VVTEGRSVRRSVGAVARWLGGATILAVIVWRLGTGPFLHGIRAVDGWSLAVAAGIGFVTTVCAAWRWHLVARGLGVALPLSTATAAYYRSQFFNTVLPGGVFGDVERAVRHGSQARDVGRAVRAVAWERSAGQFVQVALGLGVLLLLPSHVPAWLTLVVAAGLLGVLGCGLVLWSRPPHGASRRARAFRAAAGDIRDALLAPHRGPVIALASVVVVTGHMATLILAARTAGAISPTLQLLPLAMLVLLATAVPTNIGGWGPREGVAAWAFGAAGLGAAQGVATGTVYGLLSLAAISPAVPLLAVAWLRRRRSPGEAPPNEFPTNDRDPVAVAGRSEAGAGG
jgi:glycosyltransferase 2 family protein